MYLSPKFYDSQTKLQYMHKACMCPIIPSAAIGKFQKQFFNLIGTRCHLYIIFKKVFLIAIWIVTF